MTSNKLLVYLVIFTALSVFGSGAAYARTGGTIPCTDKATTTCTSKQEALDIAKSSETATKQAVNYGNTDAGGYGEFTARYESHTVVNEGTPDEYLAVIYKDVAPWGAVLNAGTLFFYWKPKECSPDDPPLSGGWVAGDWQNDTTMPTAVCFNGCKYSQPIGNRDVSCVDGQCWTRVNGFTATGQTCAAGDASLTGDPPTDSDGDGVSDGNDPSPNNPGESGGNGDNPPNGSGNDSGDGSGNGNQSSGGGSCGAPPSSSGDAILAQIAYQTWATRCAIESAKDGNGNLKTTQGGSGTGSGTGSNPGTGSGNGSCGDGFVNAAICATKDFVKKISDFLTGATDEAAGLDTDHGELEEPESIWADPSDGPTLNASLFGGGGSCPAPPTYMGKSLDPGGNLCMFASIIGALVLVAAYAQAAYIIGRA